MTSDHTRSKSLKWRYQVGNSQENSTRNLFFIRVLFIQMSPGPCYYYLTLPYSPCSILISASLLTQGYYVYSMCPDIIFQTILLCPRLVTSHHVTCHVTSLSCAFFIVFPGNKIKKRKVKSEKEKKRKIKIISVQASHNMYLLRKNYRLLVVDNLL